MTTAQLTQFAFSGLTLGCIYALVALGFTIIFNSTGIVNFAQGDFVMLGALLSATFASVWGLYLPVAILLAIATVALIGGLMLRILIQPLQPDRSLFLPVMMTMGASIVFNAVALLLWGADPLNLPAFSGEAPIRIFGATIVPQMLWIGGSLVATVLLLTFFFRRTRIGQAVLATSMNRDAAASLGVNVPVVMLVSFVWAGALGALGGVLIAPITTATHDMGASMTLKGFTAAILGGLGSVPGALIGGLALGLFEAMSAGVISSGYRDALALSVLLVVLMLKPSGIMGSAVLKR